MQAVIGAIAEDEHDEDARWRGSVKGKRANFGRGKCSWWTDYLRVRGGRGALENLMFTPRR